MARMRVQFRIWENWRMDGKTRKLGFAALLAVALFCLNRGCSAVNASPSWVAGTAWFAAAAAFLVVVIWLWDHTSGWHWIIRTVCSMVVVAVIAVATYGPISNQYNTEHTPVQAKPKTPPVTDGEKAPDTRKTEEQQAPKAPEGEARRKVVAKPKTEVPRPKAPTPVQPAPPVGNSGSVGTLTQGPCSVAQIGGSNNQATGGNCGPPPPKLTWSQEEDPAAGKTTITLGVDRSMEIPVFIAQCDRPCRTLRASAAPGMSQINSRDYHPPDNPSKLRDMTLIEADLPRPLGAGIKITWDVQSEDGKPVRIISVLTPAMLNSSRGN